MKILQRIIIYLILTTLLFAGIFFVLVRQHAKPIIEHQLARIFQQPVAIRSIKIFPPARIVVEQFAVPNIVEAREISIQLSVPNVFKKEWVVSSLRLRQPVFYARRDDFGRISLGEPSSHVIPSSTPEQLVFPRQSGVPHFGDDWSVVVKHLEIQGGKVFFVDLKNSIDAKVQKIYLTARGITYPLDPRAVRFVFKGEIESSRWPFPGSQVEARGWVSWLARDLEAQMLVSTPEGRKLLSAKAKAAHNELDVSGRTAISSLDLNVNPTQIGEDFSLPDFFLGAAKTAGVKVDMDFQFQTKLDQFQINKVSVSGNFGYSADGKSALKMLQEKITAPPENAVFMPGT